MAASPHFFKVILRETLQAGKLGIPRKFAAKYGNGMSGAAILRVKNGEVWKVELVKCDGKFWLKRGWPEFSKHYSLGHGHFLVFRYEGNCNFHVLIFDRSASEIEYPYTSNNHGQSKSLPQQEIKECKEDEQPIQIVKEIPPSRKRRGTLCLPSPQPQKTKRTTNSAHKTMSIVKSASLASEFRHKGRPDRKCEKNTRSRRIYKLKGDNKAEALQRARAFQSDNPYFKIVMQPTYVGFNRWCALAVPRYFVKKHLMEKDCCKVILYNSNGRTWTVSYHRSKSRKYGTLKAGWKTFAQDNNIQVHDVCVFELINCIQISFKVVIYPGQVANYHQPFSDAFRPVKSDVEGSSQGQSSRKQLNNIEDAKALQLASDFRSENPFFSVVMQPSYVRKSLSVPGKFARRHFTNMNNRILLLVSNGKSWPVKYYQHDQKKISAKFSVGWKKFAADNNLQVGDGCVFELTPGTEKSEVMSLKVTINRKQAVKDANLGSSLAYKSGEEEDQVECKESLAIINVNAESNLVHHKAEFQLPNIKEKEKDAPRETFDDISLSK